MQVTKNALVVSTTLLLCLSIGCDSQVGSSQSKSVSQSVKDSVVDDKPAQVPSESLKFFDLNAKLHEPFANESTKAVVLVFIATDCPIANYYQPTLARLAENYADDDIGFYLIHADGDLSEDAATKHAREFKITSPVVLDKNLTIAKLVAAEVTPEAHLIDRTGKVLYRGRIDDLYADYGKRRREPTTHELRDAIECVARGKEIKASRTKAVGCYIPYPTNEDSE